ncbi:MAG: 4a-hydroxytetrahydrobiopterin dehydratase [Hyphomicrobiales bacterium]
MAVRLTDEERAAALAPLTDWQEVDGREAITRAYKFKDFNEAFGWMTRVAMVAEKMEHHPEWANVYNSVKVTLSTHDAGGITQLDVNLAIIMDMIAADMSSIER